MGICGVEGFSLIPAQAGIWCNMTGPVSRLRGNERTIQISADAREGGYLCLDICLQRAARFKHGFPSSREPAGNDPYWCIRSN